MNTYKCRRCGTEVSMERRAHKCDELRAIYHPAFPKPNKQSTVPGYMKRFGSRKARS